MKVSIVTICRNNEKDIRPTIESVVSQTYPNIEYIIVDGLSTDKTLDIVAEYNDKVAKVTSGKDKNLYDAINKGLKMATGDIVGLIHAGDCLYDNTAIAKIACVYENDPELMITYGHSKIFSKDGKVVRVNKSPEYKKSLCRSGWFPSHQSIYARRVTFEKYGYYDTEVGWAADYQWFIRMFYVQNVKIKLVDAFIVRFAMGGTSTSNYKSRLTKKHGVMMRNCWLTNGVKAPCCIVGWQVFRKIKQIMLAKFEYTKRVG